MTKSVTRQLDYINPSVPDALFRRLMREEELAYLRDDDKSIIGFEVDLKKSDSLHGKVIIAINKHTILAYRSDLNEPKKLIIFPSMEKLFDTAFELSGIYVKRCIYTDERFEGRFTEEGLLGAVVAPLTPPAREVDLPDSVTDEMVQAMYEAAVEYNSETKKIHHQGIDDEFYRRANVVNLNTHPHLANLFQPANTDTSTTSQPVEHFDHPDDYPGDYPDHPFDPPFDPPEELEPIQTRDSRAQLMADSTFHTVTDVGNKATILGVPPTVVTQILNKVLQAPISDDQKVTFARELFIKIFEDRMYGV